MSVSVIFALFSSGVSLANAPITDKLTVAEQTPEVIQMWVQQFAQEYGASHRDILAVGFCESGFNENAVGDNGKSINVFQWQESFWNDVTNRMGQKLDRNSSYDQSKATAWIFANGSESDKRKWTTYRALKNGGVYTFKSHNKTYIVKCSYHSA